MKYRLAVLHEKESISADKTFVVDVNTEDPISRIDLHIRATNNGNTPTAHPAKCLTKIEVVDGSEVLYAMSGPRAQALAYHAQKMQPQNTLNFVNDEQAQASFSLPFGRYLWDREIALDPKRFKNLQLKVSYDLDAGGSAPDAGQFEAVAWLFDQQKVNPVGVLTAKEHYSYTLSASAYETVQLPVDMPIKLLMVDALTADKQPHDQYNELRIDEDNDKRVVLDQQTSDLFKYLASELPVIVEGLRAVPTTSEVNHYVTPGYMVAAAISGMDDYLTYGAINSLNGGCLGVKAANAGYNINAIVRGLAPHNALGLDFGDRNDFEDWWDVRALKSARLRIKAGSGASGTCTVSTQQFKRY